MGGDAGGRGVAGRSGRPDPGSGVHDAASGAIIRWGDHCARRPRQSPGWPPRCELGSTHALLPGAHRDEPSSRERASDGPGSRPASGAARRSRLRSRGTVQDEEARHLLPAAEEAGRHRRADGCRRRRRPETPHPPHAETAPQAPHRARAGAGTPVEAPKAEAARETHTRQNPSGTRSRAGAEHRPGRAAGADGGAGHRPVWSRRGVGCRAGRGGGAGNCRRAGGGRGVGECRGGGRCPGRGGRGDGC
jgi:hypothetical protein